MEEKRTKKRVILGLIIIIILVGIGSLKVGSFLPVIGALDTPANTGVSEYYIEHALEETHAYNIVTAVLADYRGFDTLFETCVLFLSGIAVMTILATKDKIPKVAEPEKIKSQHRALFGSVLMDGAFRIIVPIILIYGMYVLFHGELSLGGGFQAGALIACAYMLNRIVPRFDKRAQKANGGLTLIIAGLGAFIYLVTGLLPMFNGGKFLEYEKLPFGAESVAKLHADGILMIEIGVTICVAGIIITILEEVLERTDFND